MFSVRREQGRLASSRPWSRCWPPTRAATAPGGRAWPRCWSSSAWRPRRAGTLGRVVADGLDPFRASLWLASLVYLTDACTALGDEAVAALRLPGARALRGRERDDRSPRRVLRRGRSLPRDARRHARRGGPRAGATSSARSSSTGALGAPTWYAHSAYEYARFLLGRGRRERRQAAWRCWARPRRLAERIGMPALLEPDPRPRPALALARAPGPAVAPRSADPRARRARA